MGLAVRDGLRVGGLVQSCWQSNYKEKGSRKEGETERQRDSAAQGVLLMPVGTCTW